jgi:hypothetical protein
MQVQGYQPKLGLAPAELNLTTYIGSTMRYHVHIVCYDMTPKALNMSRILTYSTISYFCAIILNKVWLEG